MKESIESLRKVIDEIDNDIIRLLDKRMDLAYKIGELKGKDNIEVFAAEREKEIRRNLRNIKTDTIKSEELVKIFTHIIEAGRAHGYLGHTHSGKNTDKA